MGRQVSDYPFAILLKDYARAIAGLAIVALILFAAGEAAPAFKWFVAGLGVLFLCFLFQTIGRHRQRVEFDDERISLFGPLFRGRNIRWRDLRHVRLRYWGKRSKKNGVLALSLSDGKNTIVVDEGLRHFPSLIERVTHIAEEKKLQFDDITADNMIALKKIWGENDTIIDGARP